MKTEQAKSEQKHINQNPNEARYYSDGEYIYTLSPTRNGNPHDLWFWRVNKKTHDIITANGGIVRRIYLGSKNLEPSGLDWLGSISRIDD